MTPPQAAPTTSATSACPTATKDLMEARRVTVAAPWVIFLTRASKASRPHLLLHPRQT